jgi:3-isopropylmalate dehydrogenase
LPANSSLRIAVIPGDGTGPEVTAEALKVLAAVSKIEKFTYETQPFDWGGERFLKSGETLPAPSATPT